MIFKLSRLNYILLKFLTILQHQLLLTTHRGQSPFLAIHPTERPEGSPDRIMKMKGGVTDSTRDSILPAGFPTVKPYDLISRRILNAKLCNSGKM